MVLARFTSRHTHTFCWRLTVVVCRACVCVCVWWQQPPRRGHKKCSSRQSELQSCEELSEFFFSFFLSVLRFYLSFTLAKSWNNHPLQSITNVFPGTHCGAHTHRSSPAVCKQLCLIQDRVRPLESNGRKYGVNVCSVYMWSRSRIIHAAISSASVCRCTFRASWTHILTLIYAAAVTKSSRIVDNG